MVIAAYVVLVLLLVPLVYLTALFILGAFGMQKMVDHVASRSQNAAATAPQNTSDTSIGQTMSQSMRGCSRLAKPYSSAPARFIGAESPTVWTGA